MSKVYAYEKACHAFPDTMIDISPTLVREHRQTFVRGYHTGEKDLMDKAEKWLRDIYSQFDITDTNGYAIDIDTMVCKFRQAMTENKQTSPLL